MKIIGVISQKGGVGKSTVARAVAREFSNAEWDVLIADLDTYQSTSFEWNSRRLSNDVEPFISVQQFPTVDRALKAADKYDLVLLDGGASASRLTSQIANEADLVLLPTASSIDDLNPQIRLAHQLVKKGVDKRKIHFVLSMVSESEVEVLESIDYIEQSGHKVVKGSIPRKRGYSSAMDQGKTITETSFKGLNSRADEVIESIVKEIELLTE